MSKRLYRSRSDRVLGGVCAGLGVYLGIDPVIVRVFFVALALAQGLGVLFYLLLWIIVPAEGREEATLEETVREGAEEVAERAQRAGEEVRRAEEGSSRQAGVIIGAGLILFGGFLFLRNLGLPWPWCWISMSCGPSS